MKILILAQSRSGSTSLNKAIYDKTKIPMLYEPFKPINKEIYEVQANKIIESSELLVKIVDSNFMFYENFKDYKDLVKHFDLVIGLTRSDCNENAKSKLVAEITNDWVSSYKKHKIDENIFLTEDYLNKLEDSKRYKDIILSYDIFQITYEDIYINKTGIPRLEKYLGFSISEYLFS
jgi:hypothetical protein